MARPLRIEYSGAIYHVTVRGNARQKIVLDDRDRRALCGRLEESIKSYGVRLYLYCLLDNHFHLVVETPRANLRRFMQSVLTGYTVSFNLRHRRCGHVTQGRYGARLVAGDDYLLKLSRYVHLNPVQVKGWRKRSLAERLAHLRAYRWSSYRGYIGVDKPVEWIEYGPMLGLTRQTGGREGRWYEAFVEAGLEAPDEVFRDELERSPLSIGDEEFREWVSARHREVAGNRLAEDIAFRQERGVLSVEAVMGRVAAGLGVKAEELKARRHGWAGKGVAALMLEKYAGLTRRACAPWIGLTSGMGAGYQIRQAVIRLKHDPKLKRQVEKLDSFFEKESGG